MNTILKFYEKILDKRLRDQTIDQISELQGGSQRNKGCVDMHIILQELIEQNKKEEMILCSYDLSKAYDRVNRDLLWNKLRTLNVDEHLIQAIMSTYSCTRICLNIGKFKSKKTAFKHGIKQGSVLSPILYIIYVNDLIKDLMKTNTGLTLKTGKNTRKIPCLMFVDDLLLMAKSTEEIKILTNALTSFLNKNYAVINKKKTEIMANYISPELKKWLEENNYKNNSNIKYLGITININNSWTDYIEQIKQKINKKFHPLKRRGVFWKEINPINCIQLIKKLIIPTATYGAELLTLTLKNKSHIDKKIAYTFKETLGLKGYTPTNWVLWEIDQPQIEWIIKERKLNYWWKIQNTKSCILQKEILNTPGSVFNKAIQKILDNKEGPKHTKKAINTKEYTWRKTNKKWISTNRKISIKKIRTENHQHQYFDIKPNSDIIPEIFDTSKFPHKIIKTILHARAQTLSIPSDINSKTDKECCPLCENNQCSIIHLLHECKTTNKIRKEYLEALNSIVKNKLDSNTVKHIKQLTKKEQFQNIISLNLTNNTECNETIMVITAIALQDINKLKKNKEK